MAKRSIDSNKMSSTVKFMGDLAKGLPSGWRVEIRTRGNGSRAGSKYMCYTAPITGCKFYSKGEVSRYLKSRPKMERIIFSNSEKHVVFVEQRDMVDGLPPGWTMELKFTRSGDGTRVRTDPYYTDPVSGYVFRSRKDVLHYIKTGEVGKYAFKAKGDINRAKQIHAKPSSSLAAGRQKLNGNLLKEHLSTSQCSKSEELIKDESIMDSSTAVVGEEITQLSSLTSLHTKRSKRRKGKKAIVKKGLPSTCLTNVPRSENQLEENGKEGLESRKTPLGSRKRGNKVELDTPRRISKRLAGINAELVGNMVRSNGTTQPTVMLPPGESKLAVHPTSSCLVAEPLNQSEDEKEGKTTPHVVRDEDPHKHENYHVETVEQTTTVEAKNPIGRLAGISSGLASNMVRPNETPEITVGIDPISPCLDAEPLNPLESEKEGKFTVHAARDEDPLKHDTETIVSTTTVEAVRGGGEEILEQCTSHVGAKEKSTEPCDRIIHGKVGIDKQENEKLECDLALPLGELCRDPCLEFAFKTLTGEISVEDNDVNVPTLDPCLEFAYKTLTGEIPMEEVSLTVSGAIPTSDPCIEFAYKTLTGAIPETTTAQTVEVPYSIPTSDPCLEFAYKTLTGAIPVEDSLAIQNYFQHQLGSAQKKMSQNNTVEHPDFSFNDFQTNTFFHFDETAKPASPTAKGPAGESTSRRGHSITQHPSKDGKMDRRRR